MRRCRHPLHLLSARSLLGNALSCQAYAVEVPAHELGVPCAWFFSHTPGAIPSDSTKSMDFTGFRQGSLFLQLRRGDLDSMAEDGLAVWGWAGIWKGCRKH